MVIPSCGNHSASVWDASSAEELQAWVDQNLMDGTHTIAEVPEEFCFGISLELGTSRAADKVASGSKATLDKVATSSRALADSMAEKLDRLDQRTNLITATREATSSAVSKMVESEGVQKSLASINAGLVSASTSMGRAFSWVGSQVKASMPRTQAAAAVSDGGAGLDPPTYTESYGAPAYMPVSTNATRPSGDAEPSPPPVVAPAEAAPPAPHFTLQDDCPLSGDEGGPEAAPPAADAEPHVPVARAAAEESPLLH
ncbi:hypothetical protein HYH03_006508 [Edaphochlamys debaryana]|uniref:Uncharacterized protein n=1 Tax=Edaphochlamys debaryana TaxID=47281 RepID=A0A836C012_9CHLO|nr:hypothetical protein HYH03_006508 [Edaphochlamys debaryana]|eukprot:KAG2495235.1 hypothetical protein HYH03_006508 [Edaphochlamys debaryana]